MLQSSLLLLRGVSNEKDYLMNIISEQDIGKLAAEWLGAEGFDVYHEVHVGKVGGTRCADLVGIRYVRGKAQIHVIECKKRYGVSVLEQAYHWRVYGMADFITVATPERKRKARRSGRIYRNRRRSPVFDLFHKHTGIGWLSFNSRGFTIEDEPEQQTRDSYWGNSLLESCTPHHRSGKWAQAGSANARRVTKFALTCRRLREAVQQNPGERTMYYISQIEHHYSSHRSAAACLGRLCRQGVVTGVYVCEREFGALYLFPDQTTEGEMKTTFRFITFEAVDRDNSEPRQWRIMTKQGQQIGSIEWLQKWKKFVFHPSADAVYDRSCLDDVSIFMEQLLS